MLLAPTGNALATASAVQAKMDELARFFPANIKYDIPYNITPVVEASIQKVLITMVEAVVLVFLVMFLFLQNFRYTLIPTIVVPVSLLGAFPNVPRLEVPAATASKGPRALRLRASLCGRHGLTQLRKCLGAGIVNPDHVERPLQVTGPHSNRTSTLPGGDGCTRKWSASQQQS